MSQKNMSKLAVVAALIALASFASAYNIIVGAGKVECFMEEVQDGEKVVGSYSVLYGGGSDIDFKLTDPYEKTVYQEEKDSHGTFSFIASGNGLYKMCFSNTMSTVTSKTVNFHIHAGNALASASVAKKEHLSGLEMSVVTMSESLNFLADEIDYLKNRERVHRDTNESTNSRVVWWSLLENFLLLAMGIGQIYYLKTFFEQRRSV